MDQPRLADSSTPQFGRRTLLRAAVGGTTAAATLGGLARTGTAQQSGGTTRVVEMTDTLVFAPESIIVAPGDTVVWENVGNAGHSVTAYEDSLPEGASYFASGGFETESAARRAYSPGDAASGDVVGGETYRHTFDVEGVYEYFCIPHETVGMVGSVDVRPGGPPVPEAVAPILPDDAKTLAVGASFAFTAVLALTYFFLKYGEESAESDDLNRRRPGGA